MGLNDAFQDAPDAYRSIFENTGTAMAVVDKDMKILLVNSELVRLSGYGKKELEGRRLWTDFVCTEDVERMVRYHRERRAGKTDIPSRYTFRTLDRQGRVREVSINVTLIPGTGRSIASLIDISDQKQAERDLRESEQRYRHLVEDMPALICRFRSDGTLTFVNQAYCRYFDRSQEDLLGFNFFHFIPAEERERVRAHFRSLTPSRPMVTYEHTVVDRRGELRWQQWTDRALFTESGEVIEFQSLGQDVTERKQAEEEKERIRSQLYQAQRMETVGRLTAGFAHDCSNVLTVIIGFADILLSRTDHGSEFRGPLEAVTSAARRGEALTKKLLAFSRKQVLQPELLHIDDLIAGTRGMLQQLLGEDVKLIVVPDAEIPPVKVDRVQLEQVIINLVINARDAMPVGGELRIETGTSRFIGSEPDLPVGTGPATYVTIEVSDTGTGMETDILTHIFEPFYTTKEAGRGTGLGLSISYGIVRQSGGFIQVESSPGTGSTFRVCLPACPEGVVRQPQMVAEEKPAAGREIVLVAEDDENVRALLEGLLRVNGYSVLTAGSGSEALALLRGRKSPIDLLVTDLVMPGLNGCELAEQFTSEQPDVKILYISGYAPDNVPACELWSDGKSYLAKPFSAELFLNRVGELLHEP